MDKSKREQNLKPGLYIVSTPIGNMEDITLRAINVLKKSKIILCEDTRRSEKLLSYFHIKNVLLSYHKFNEKKVSDKIVNYIKQNEIISLISDAGTPAISDPGQILINKCLKDNLSIYPIPGPSAVTSALSISGFNDQYLFYGFLTKKEKELESVLNGLKDINYAIVFFIPVIKLNFYLKKFKNFFFDRKIVIAREMTKIHEEFIRGEIKSIEIPLLSLKGEVTVVISGKDNEKKSDKEINESVKIEINKMLKKYTLKDVVEYIVKKENLSKKMVYHYCLKMKK